MPIMEKQEGRKSAVCVRAHCTLLWSSWVNERAVYVQGDKNVCINKHRTTHRLIYI